MKNLTSLKTVLTSGLCFTGVVLGSCTHGEIEKPNIIFVFSDQQNAYELSAALGGDPVIKTPNLDKLASQGVQFTRYASNNPICVPFRATLMTGQYGQNNGLPFNTTRSVPDRKPGLQPDKPLFPMELKKSGYKMGYVGKWHLYPEGKEYDIIPEEYRYGFTDYWRKSSNYQDRYNTGYYDEEGKYHLLEGYAPKAQMEQVMDFVKIYKDEPFCIVLSWHPPHPPYPQAPQEWVDYYGSQDIRFRDNVPEECRDDRRLRNIIGAYAHVSAMDEEIGRLMNLLAELGIEDNTLLVYSSDHGDLLGAHGWFNKRAPWNESILVPMIMRYPNGIKAGQKDPSPLSGVDIAPTLLGFAGVSVPEEMDGTDFSDYILGRRKQAPESAFLIGIAPDNISEDDWEQHRDKRKMAYDWRGFYTGTYTYTLRRENGKIIPWMLFDNERDTYQMNNLVNDPNYQTIINGMQKQMNQYLASVGEQEWMLD